MDKSPARFEPGQGDAFAAHLQGAGRLLGLDPGAKTIGLAISDSGWSIASPVRTLKRTKFMQDAEALLTYAASEGVAGLVLGLPLNMDGSEGPSAQSSRAFARNLAKLSPLPLMFQDERLSTAAAGDALGGVRLERAKREGKVDAVAAAIILQACCDAMRRFRRDAPAAS